jgi:NADH-quinone oxidoreductase subunit M
MAVWSIYISFIGAGVLALLPRERHVFARWVALLTAIAGMAFALTAALAPQAGDFQVLTRRSWIPALGAEYFLGVDGISLTLIVLTGLAAICGILFSWNVRERAPEFFALYLALIGSVYGVFLSFDLLLFFVFYELAIVPKYFLIAIYGSTRREYGAMKLALYSFVGSAMVLVGLLAAYVVSGGQTFDLLKLAEHPFPREFQMWAFPLVFVGFAILAGLWPLHTWAPTGHVAAPTAASMLLAGVIMKLGAYGCLRVALTLFPRGLESWGFQLLGFGSWQDVFGFLAAMGIVAGAMVALVQRDFKFVIGYSSVSHMGFVLLGLVTLSTVGLRGAVLQMFSHGVIAGLLFGVVGRMVYDRAHTRDFALLPGLHLGRALPFAAVIFCLAGFASMGLPGFSGFVAELQVLVGAWKAFPWLAILAGVGIVIGVAYTLRAMQKAFFDDAASGSNEANPAVHLDPDPITLPERIGALILLATSLVVGLYPRILLDWIDRGLATPIFDALRRGGLS